MFSRIVLTVFLVCPVINFNRDGAMRHKITKGVNYWPNRFGTAAPQGKKFEAAGIVTECVLTPRTREGCNLTNPSQIPTKDYWSETASSLAKVPGALQPSAALL